MSSLQIEDLRETLRRIDGRGYRAYQEIRGVYALGIHELTIAHVQADPFAPPSRLHVRVPLRALGLGEERRASAAQRLGLADFLGRSLAGALREAATREIEIDRYGQEILHRSAVRIGDAHLEARLGLHLPADGRRIRAQGARTLLCHLLPRILAAALQGDALDLRALRAHQDAIEDHDALVAEIERRGWVAFLADGALLARRAGNDDRPLSADAAGPAVGFRSPASLAAEVSLPHAGRLRGMALPRGVSLIVGGGFHGKSTLLEALARGIHPHIPGDGRERVAVDPLAVKIRAEDGRAVSRTDIRPFVSALPGGRSTAEFSTPNASGSTSQAANIVEALDAGARVLLIDEDTSATNFMIRDEPMRRLLQPGQEPITPFLERVRALHCNRGVSTVLVMGGSGEYFRVADRVIQMDQYLPEDVTARARQIVAHTAEPTMPFPEPPPARRFSLSIYRRRLGPRGARMATPGGRRIVIEREELDLGACEQLVCPSQARTLGEILARLIEGEGRAERWTRLAGGFSAGDMEALCATFASEGFDDVSRYPRGDLAAVRALEVVAMINRLRDLVVAS